MSFLMQLNCGCIRPPNVVFKLITTSPRLLFHISTYPTNLTYYFQSPTLTTFHILKRSKNKNFSKRQRASSNQQQINNYSHPASYMSNGRQQQYGRKQYFLKFTNTSANLGNQSCLRSQGMIIMTVQQNFASLPRSDGHWKWPTTYMKDPRPRGGSRMWYPPVNSVEEARNLALNLDPTGRKLLKEQLIIIEEQQEVHSLLPLPVENSELVKAFLINLLPFIGFGILDNGIMIIAGEYIDRSIGVAFGLSTMAAAAFGNLISDLAGVGTAGYIDNLVSKFHRIQPTISQLQYNFRSVRWAIFWGRAFGITIGCLLGMLPLFFYDHGDDHDHDDDSNNKNKNKKQNQDQLTATPSSG